ncbi:MAG: enoyl-CoA hydratase/isomerase family protein [Acidobacteriota bacterium]
MIRLEHHGRVVEARLDRGVTNAIDLRVVAELAEVVQEVTGNPGVRGLVLSSANDKFFSIGFDIPRLYELSREEFARFYQAYNQTCLKLFTLPKPVVAAITGHAIAGGCILALCCDYRFIAQGRKLMGLNEVKLGVPVPYLGDCIVRQLAGMRSARDIMEGGEFYASDRLLQMGLVDEVLPIEQVLPRAIEKATALGELPAEALAMIKRNRVEPVESQILAHLEEREEFFLRWWYAEDTRGRLREAITRF